MEVSLSDFSQGNIKAYVTEEIDDEFLVDIPIYHLFLILKRNQDEWECISYTGIYNPVWVKEIGYQITHSVFEC